MRCAALARPGRTRRPAAAPRQAPARVESRTRARREPSRTPFVPAYIPPPAAAGKRPISSPTDEPMRLATSLLTLVILTAIAAAQERPQVGSLRVTVLSTMLAGDTAGGIGEWGFAALVEADGRRILFDTGARPETVLANARELKIDLAGVSDLVISHNHGDHTGGLLTLRTSVRDRDPMALSRAHVGRGIFWPRPAATGDTNGLLRIKDDYERSGGRFIEHSSAEQIAPGIWVTGPVPRAHPERNWGGSGRVQTPDGIKEDDIPEDM